MTSNDYYALPDNIAFKIFAGIFSIAGIIEFILFGAVWTWGNLVTIFRHGSTGGTRILASLTLLLFWGLRAIYLPILLWMLPGEPISLERKYLDVAVVLMSASYSFVLLIQLVTMGVRAIRRLLTNRKESEEESGDKIPHAPTVVIIVPVFNEMPDVLNDVIMAVVSSAWPKHRLHLYLSFDDDTQSQLYLHTLKRLGAPAMDSYPRHIDIEFRSCHVTVTRFPHGGKRKTQQRTFEMVQQLYAKEIKSMTTGGVPLLLLFMDSDVLLHRHSIRHMVHEMVGRGDPEKQKIAITALLLSRSGQDQNMLQVMQDIEYMRGQMDRVLETLCGGVTCLPGAITMCRADTFQEVSLAYFGFRSENALNKFDFFRYTWGEDRFLTQLFLKQTPKAYRVKMSERASCKTVAPGTWGTLYKQRRRWFFGTLANEIALLSSPTLWSRYPVLCVVRLFNDALKSLSIVSYLLVLSAAVYAKNDDKLAMLAVILWLMAPFLLNVIVMTYLGFTLRRFKVLLYPLVHVLSTFFDWTVLLYATFTGFTRSWGTRGANAVADINMQVPPRNDGTDEEELICDYSEAYDKHLYIRKSRDLMVVTNARKKTPFDISLTANRLAKPAAIHPVRPQYASNPLYTPASGPVSTSMSERITSEDMSKYLPKERLNRMTDLMSERTDGESEVVRSPIEVKTTQENGRNARNSMQFVQDTVVKDWMKLEKELIGGSEDGSDRGTLRLRSPTKEHFDSSEADLDSFKRKVEHGKMTALDHLAEKSDTTTISTRSGSSHGDRKEEVLSVQTHQHGHKVKVSVGRAADFFASQAKYPAVNSTDQPPPVPAKNASVNREPSNKQKQSQNNDSRSNASQPSWMSSATSEDGSWQAPSSRPPAPPGPPGKIITHPMMIPVRPTAPGGSRIIPQSNGAPRHQPPPMPGQQMYRPVPPGTPNAQIPSKPVVNTQRPQQTPSLKPQPNFRPPQQ